MFSKDQPTDAAGIRRLMEALPHESLAWSVARGEVLAMAQDEDGRGFEGQTRAFQRHLESAEAAR